jgi:hypothetical protein
MSITTAQLITNIRAEINRPAEDPLYNNTRILSVVNRVKDTLAAEIRRVNADFFIIVGDATALAANTETLALPAGWLKTVRIEVKTPGLGDDAYETVPYLEKTAPAFRTISGFYDRIGMTLYFSNGGWSSAKTFRIWYASTPLRLVEQVVDEDTETALTDDLLFPDWYLVPASGVILLAGEEQGTLTQLLAAQAQEAKDEVIANVRSTEPNSPVRMGRTVQSRRV